MQIEQRDYRLCAAFIRHHEDASVAIRPGALCHASDPGYAGARGGDTLVQRPRHSKRSNRVVGQLAGIAVDVEIVLGTGGGFNSHPATLGACGASGNHRRAGWAGGRATVTGVFSDFVGNSLSDGSRVGDARHRTRWFVSAGVDQTRASRLRRRAKCLFSRRSAVVYRWISVPGRHSTTNRRLHRE